MNKLIDAEDEICRARNLVLLIQMACTYETGDAPEAIGGGCESAIDALENARQLVNSSRKQQEPS